MAWRPNCHLGRTVERPESLWSRLSSSIWLVGSRSDEGSTEVSRIFSKKRVNASAKGSLLKSNQRHLKLSIVRKTGDVDFAHVTRTLFRSIHVSIVHTHRCAVTSLHSRQGVP
ncbi:unnamed protein product [Protopolystoma xenopodis]|uniref:Uncharacterized protein n=1 Tax=Protopolystoma xenopodis TaxID=117903 RepID=A0A448X435_9PLAT|nr:unnamed protein product [Protopolystoma xenopodis]